MPEIPMLVVRRRGIPRMADLDILVRRGAGSKGFLVEGVCPDGVSTEARPSCSFEADFIREILRLTPSAALEAAFEREAICSYLRGHAEEALDSTTRAALFWAAEHIESGDHLAQEAPPEKEKG